jgi:hypothetical protein
MVVMKYTHVCVCINISLSFSQDISRVVHAKTLRDWLIPAEAAALNVIIRRKRKKIKKKFPVSAATPPSHRLSYSIEGVFPTHIVDNRETYKYTVCVCINTTEQQQRQQQGKTKKDSLASSFYFIRPRWVFFSRTWKKEMIREGIKTGVPPPYIYRFRRREE